LRATTVDAVVFGICQCQCQVLYYGHLVPDVSQMTSSLLPTY
jgi:hypothetical protein